MRMRWSLSVAIASALSAAVVAQSSKDMAASGHNAQMKMTYTGCVQAANHGGMFILLPDGEDRMMTSDHDDTMKHEPAMKNDAAMKHEPMSDDGKMDTMRPQALVLTGSSELKKHAGHHVSVTGSLSDAMHGSLSTLTVKTLTLLSTTCSPEAAR